MPGNGARAGSIKQRDIAGLQHRAAVVLFNLRAAFQLKYGVEPGIVTVVNLMAGSEQVNATCGYGA